MKETIGTANPGNSKEAVPEGGKCHRTLGLFEIFGRAFAVQVPTVPAPCPVHVCSSRPLSHTCLLHILARFTHTLVTHTCASHTYGRFTHTRGSPHIPTCLLHILACFIHTRLLHIVVRFTLTVASLTHAAGREGSP